MLYSPASLFVLSNNINWLVVKQYRSPFDDQLRKYVLNASVGSKYFENYEHSEHYKENYFIVILLKILCDHFTVKVEVEDSPVMI